MVTVEYLDSWFISWDILGSYKIGFRRAKGGYNDPPADVLGAFSKVTS